MAKSQQNSIPTVTAKFDTPAQQVFKKISENLQHILFHPFLTEKLIASIKDGEEITPRRKLKLEIEWNHEDADKIARHLEDWITTGSFDHLVELLKEHPHNIGNPLVFNQIFHLRRLLNYGAWENSPVGGHTPLVGGQKEPLEYDAKLAIEGTLYKLLSAWIGHMLPGYTIQPVVSPPKRGAPNRLDGYELQALLIEFNDLMEHLEIIEGQHDDPLGHKRGETYTQFCRRMAEVVQSLHLQSVYSFETYKVKPEPFSPSKDELLSIWKDNGTRWRKVRLKPSLASAIARHAIKNGKVQKRKLVYRLLGFHHPYLKGRESVRGQIERAEAQFPPYHRFKVKKGNT